MPNFSFKRPNNDHRHAEDDHELLRPMSPPTLAIDDRARDLAVIVAFLSWFLPLLSSCCIPPSQSLLSLSPNFSTLTIENMTPASASALGSSFHLHISTSPTTVSAVSSFLTSSPFLHQLDELLPNLFRPCLFSIASLLMNQIDIGSTVRLYVGAVLGIVDLVSDAVAIVSFYSNGLLFYAHACLIVFGMSFFWQFIIVYYQNRRLGLKRCLLEIIFVVTAVKPGVDAFRASSNGGEQEEGTLLDPRTLLLLSKGAMLFCESIPSSLLQFMAAMQYPEQRTLLSIFSIAMSILQMTFTASVISFDKDTTLENRRASPYYGLFNDGYANRGWSFIFMWLVGIFHLTSKLLSCSVLAQEGYALLYYVLADTAIYLTYKLVRQDMLYWLPIDGLAGSVSSVVQRIGLKIIADFTGMIHARHPCKSTNSPHPPAHRTPN